MNTVYSVCHAWDARTAAYFETLAALADLDSDFNVIVCDASDDPACAIAIRGALALLPMRSWRYVRLSASLAGDWNDAKDRNSTLVEALIVLRETCATDEAVWWPTALSVNADDVLRTICESARPPCDEPNFYDSLVLVDVATLRTQPTTTEQPKTPQAVAVVITSHNYGKYLRQALQSIYDQTLQPAEVIVVDDDSTDDTAAVAAEFSDRGASYVRGTWRSASRARNEGASRSTSPLLLFLDADDYLDRRYLELTVPHFDDPQIGIVYGNWQFTELYDHLFDAPEFDRMLLRYSGYIKTDALFRREALHQVRGFRAEVHFEDWDLARRITAAGWNAKKAPGAQTFYRYHSAGRMVTYTHGRTERKYGVEAEIAKYPFTLYTAIDTTAWNAPSYLQTIETLGINPRYLTLHWIDISPERGEALANLLANVPAASVQYTRVKPSDDASDVMAIAAAVAQHDVGSDFGLLLASDVTVRPYFFNELCDRLEGQTAALIVGSDLVFFRSELLRWNPKEHRPTLYGYIDQLRALSTVVLLPDDAVERAITGGAETLNRSLAEHLWSQKAPAVLQAPPRCLAIISTTGSDVSNLARCLDALRFGSHGVAITQTILVSPPSGESNARVQEFAASARIATSLHAALNTRRAEQFVLFLNDDCYLRYYDDVMNLIATLRDDHLACVEPRVGLGCTLWDARWIDRFGPFGRGLRNFRARRGRSEKVVVSE